jgi:hypothetical protein
MALTLPAMFKSGQPLDPISEYFQNKTILTQNIGGNFDDLGIQFWLISFWSSNELKPHNVSFQILENNNSEYFSKFDYIISKKQLPLNIAKLDEKRSIILYSMSVDENNASNPDYITLNSGFFDNHLRFLLYLLINVQIINIQ